MISLNLDDKEQPKEKPKRPAKPNHEALLTELKDRFQNASDYWREIRDEAKKDMLCVAGKPWEALDPKGLAQRQAAVRPALALDELNQYFNQAINQERARKRAVKFSPEGDGADDKSADFYANKMREIEYRSKAQIAYITAFENAVQRSYGYFRINTRFSDIPGSRFLQDIWIEDIPNPDMVLLDPEATRPDSSDMQWGFVFETWSVKEFQRKFKDAEVKDFSSFLDSMPLWIKADEKITLAEYWKIKQVERELVQFRLPDGTVKDVWVDELDKMPANVPVTDRRMETDRQVCQYLTNGVEILKETTWPGKYIPIVSCYGKVIYVDEGAGAKRQILSMTRLARDPYMLYCYLNTCEAEIVGMTPKTPYRAYRGQVNAKELVEVQKSLHEPVALLEFGAMTEATGNQVLPLPERAMYDPPIQALEIAKESARRAIQAAMATAFLPTSSQRRNEKSGKALQKMDEIAQTGSFHFNDHYDDMITHGGVICEDLMDKIYDTARQVGIRKPNDEAEIVWINNPEKQGISTKGRHSVTVSTGPSFDSERERASDFADTLATIPAVAAQIMDLIVKLKNLGPIGDEIAERLTPPQYRKMKEGNPTPEQMKMMLAETTGKLEELAQVAQQMKQALDTEQAKQQATIQKAQIDQQGSVEQAKIQAELQLRLQEMKDATAIRVAEINAEVKGVTQSADHAAEHERQALDHTHETVDHALEREHEKELATIKHDQALESGAQAVDGQIAVNAHKPQPTKGAEA